MTDATGRGRGRPSVCPGEKTVRLTVRVPESLYDHLSQSALRLRTDVSDLVRQTLRDDFRTRKSTSP